MTTSYPSAFDAFTNPTASDDLDDGSVLHSAQHANINDAVEAIQAVLGLNPGVFADYTPVINQGGNVTFTAVRARVARISDLAIVEGSLTVTGAGVANNNITVTLPLSCAGGGGVAIGNFIVYDVSANLYRIGAAVTTSAGTVSGIRDGVANASAIGKDPNFALAAGDAVGFRVTYEVA